MESQSLPTSGLLVQGGEGETMNYQIAGSQSLPTSGLLVQNLDWTNQVEHLCVAIPSYFRSFSSGKSGK